MAWTGFGGGWSGGVHSGGDDSGSIGGSSVKLNSAGQPVSGSSRAPSAADIASQYNSFGGQQITAAQVSGISRQADGSYSANIRGGGASSSVTGQGSTNGGAVQTSGFNAVSQASSGGTGGGNRATGAQVGGTPGGTASKSVQDQIRGGTLPAGYKIVNGKVQYTRNVTTTRTVGGAGRNGNERTVTTTKQVTSEVPAMTALYNQGVQARAQAAAAKAAQQKAAAAQAAQAKAAAAAAAAKTAQQKAAAAAAQKAAQQKAAAAAAAAKAAPAAKPATPSTTPRPATQTAAPAAKPAATPVTTQKPGAAPVTALTTPETSQATPQQAAWANSLSGRINGTLNNILGSGPQTVGGWGSVGTISGTLLGGLSGMRTGSALGPAGAIIGGIAGLIQGSGVAANLNLTGTNPNVAGVTANPESFGPGQTLVNGVRVGNANDRTSTGTAKATGTTSAPVAQASGPATSGSSLGASLLPGGVAGLVGAGQKAQNDYLQILRGRYGRYNLTTGAQGSGTNLLGRVAGGVGAVGGVQGKTLLGA